MHIGHTVGGAERSTKNIWRERCKPYNATKPDGELFADLLLGLLRYISSKKRLAIQAAGDPFRVQFKMLNQLPALGTIKNILGIQ